MKKILILSAAVAVLFSSCGGGSVSLKSEQDSLAYSVGLDLGNYIKSLDSNMNIDVVSAAIKDVISGSEKMSTEDAMAFLQNYFTVVQPAKELEASQAYLAEIEKKANVQKTASGLLYEIVSEGDMSVKVEDDTDNVSVIYEGSLRDGTVFDSSIQRGDTATFPLNRVIKGWTEGMKLVGKGGKIILYIPSELAYGAQGPTGIGANQALKFEVELVDVTPAE